MRTLSVICGVGLAALFFVGLGSPSAAAWITWLDGIAAVCSFIVAGMIRPTIEYRTFSVGPMTLAIGLFATWIIGLVSNGAPWQNWWNFVFGCCFAVAAGAGMQRAAIEPSHKTGVEADRFKKSA